LEKAMGKTAEKDFLPMQPGDVQKTYADVQDLINDFNYQPNTPLEKGIGEFVKWFVDYKQPKE
jgi:UDP-glucuronate 4-epimerase